MSSESPLKASSPRSRQHRLAEHGALIGLIALATLTAGATLGEKPSDIHHRIDQQIAARG